MEQEPTQRATSPEFHRRVREVGIDAVLREIEREAVEVALAETDGNKTHAARLLGIRRTTLMRRMVQRFGMALGPAKRATMDPPRTDT